LSSDEANPVHHTLPARRCLKRTIPADMLKTIAAINHLAVTDVVRLFLKEYARARGHGEVGSGGLLGNAFAKVFVRAREGKPKAQ
jgi:hypothetical protein